VSGRNAVIERNTAVDRNAVIAVYDIHEQAEKAVRELQKGGFDMSKLSIIGKGYETEDHVIGYYNAGDRMKHWGKYGAFWGGIWGLFLGAAFFVIPGVGPILMAGPIVGALEGAIAVGGLSVIGAGLYSLGVSKDSVIRYESALKANRFLLAVHGTSEEVARARNILDTAGAGEVAVYVKPQTEGARRA
jgi:hypothetical protein